MNYVKLEKLSLRLHPELNERWVQDRIAHDPSILGLGDLVLRDQERRHAGAGRLDLLLQDRDTKRRFEVELQLGKMDESHIIRAIEYWDIERKRYPQYEHCAVLVAEDITSRFLNVVGLFNGTIPIIALQMQALQVEDRVTLIFTKVMDELTRGAIDEDEDAESVPTNRSYWEQRGSVATLQMADEILTIAKTCDRSLELKYNKIYIGLKREGLPFNFLSLRPKKGSLVFEVKLPKSEEINARIETAGLETLVYSDRYGLYRFSLRQIDMTDKRPVIKELVEAAYRYQIA